MISIRFLQAVLVTSTFGLILVAGCSPQQAPEKSQTSKVAEISNKRCPIMGNDVDPSAKTVMWNGKKIGFCCDDCLPKWNELSDEEKAAKLADPGHEVGTGKEQHKHQKNSKHENH